MMRHKRILHVQVIGRKGRTRKSRLLLSRNNWQAKIFIFINSTFARHNLDFWVIYFFSALFSGIILFNCIKDTNICIDCDFTWSYSCLSRFGSSGKPIPSPSDDLNCCVSTREETMNNESDEVENLRKLL